MNFNPSKAVNIPFTIFPILFISKIYLYYFVYSDYLYQYYH
jgi:hypothetical protein